MVKTIFAKIDKSYPNIQVSVLTSQISVLTFLGICVLRVDLAQSQLTQRQITLRLNTQCNSYTDRNLAQTISISLLIFTK